MDTRIGENIRERSNRRPIRNKRYSRRAYGEDKRPPKRLFTPEIKRFLKDWLVRRRENPYPNRDEKKTLSIQTGLTYIQVCNWFANWRRKLKNAGKEPQRKTWGDLIKSYNTQVQGNVEHFSICSDDSIWEENSSSCSNEKFQLKYDKTIIDHNYGSSNQINNNEKCNQCYFVSSTTENDDNSEIIHNPFMQSTNKYKNHIMEKYLRDCHYLDNNKNNDDKNLSKPSMISKWLESAANFTPNESSYLVNWTFKKKTKKQAMTKNKLESKQMQHGREELDAAEALTRLANARFNHFINKSL